MSQHEALIRVDEVTYRYESDSPEGILALQNVTLDVGAGEFIGLIGQNGSGKTTLARHLNGLLKPTSGRVLVAGIDTRDVEPGRLASRVGYVFQNPDHALFLTTVREEIDYSLGFQDLNDTEREARIAGALAAFGLSDLADHHPASLGRGTRRLVILAAAYAMQPDVLVLDEPTGGLDHRLTLDLVRTLEAYVESGRSVVFISHDMQLVANTCRRVVVLSGGKLVADTTPGELYQNRDLLDRAGLRPPDLARLSTSLSDVGMPPDAVTIDGFVDQYCRLRESRDRAGG